VVFLAFWWQWTQFFQHSLLTVYFPLHLGLLGGVLHVSGTQFCTHFLTSCVQCLRPSIKVMLLFEFIVSYTFNFMTHSSEIGSWKCINKLTSKEPFQIVGDWVGVLYIGSSIIVKTSFLSKEQVLVYIFTVAKKNFDILCFISYCVFLNF
jgi:hypothetical protein